MGVIAIVAAAALQAASPAEAGFVLLEPVRGPDGAARMQAAPTGEPVPVATILAKPELERAARQALAQGAPAFLPALDAAARRRDGAAVACPGVGAKIAVYLSDEDGGFARQGFYLAADGRAPVWCADRYVDLTVDAAAVASGEFEEVLSHEYGHVLLRRLLGPVPATPTRKFHTVRTITDPVTAFDEGFGTHFQPVALRLTGTPGFRLRAEGLRPPSLADAWLSREETWLRQAWTPRNRFVHRKPAPAAADPLAAWEAEEQAVDVDPCRLKSGAQMLASEGVAASVFYRLTADGEFGRLIPVLARMGRWGDQPLIAFVQAWGDTYPADRERVVRLFLATTYGATASRETAAAAERALCDASRGDLAAFQTSRRAADAALAKLATDVLSGAVALDAATPKPIWIAAPEVKIRSAPWRPQRDAPLVLDLNTATAAELRLAFGDAAGRLAAARDAEPFADLRDAVGRARLAAAETAALRRAVQAAVDLGGEARR